MLGVIFWVSHRGPLCASFPSSCFLPFFVSFSFHLLFFLSSFLSAFLFAADQRVVVGGHLVEQLAGEARDDADALLGGAVAHHAEGLARACLAVGEETAVVALERALEQRPADAVEDVLLRGKVGPWHARPERVVVGELVLPLAVRVVDGRRAAAHGNDRLRAHQQLAVFGVDFSN